MAWCSATGLASSRPATCPQHAQCMRSALAVPVQDWGAELRAPACSHFGMLAAARWILQETVEPLKAALAESPGFRLRIVGHSLGAGAAALLTMMCAGPSRLVQSACPLLSRRCEGGEAGGSWRSWPA